ncbi:MAG: toll/interleukin-1 receptor domain-containing protein [Acidimicrobiales bacterium]|nr:toll/interleukin-1 receptor domain-containing protein [Acidimicrobiales bacterium]
MAAVPDVFISYSSQDEALATEVCTTLEPEQISCWMAPRDIPLGAHYADSIMEAIGSARLLVLVASESINHSPHVLREVERATHRRLPILALRIRGAIPSGSLTYFISGSQWLDLPDGAVGRSKGEL